MGAFDANRDDEITLKADWWDAHESCTARTIVRAGDEEWVLNQQMLIQPKQGNRAQRRSSGFQKQQADIDFKSQLGATNRLWVQKMLQSWTFTKDGMPMPFAVSGLNEIDDRRMGRIMQQLDQSYIDFIYDEIMKCQPKQVKDEQAEEDEEDDDEEGSVFTESASSTSVGATAITVQTWNDLSQSKKPSRNYLTNS